MSAELNLKVIGDFLERIAEKSHSVYWLSSADFEKIQYISPAFEVIWGVPREQLYEDPKSWASYLHPDDLLTYHPIEAMKDRINHFGQYAQYEENYRIVRPDGEVRWIMDRGFPVIDERDRCIAVCGVAVDVSREQLMEQALVKAKEHAEEASQAKSNFLMNMRHDFRTPISGIVSMVELLANSEKDQQRKEHLACIYQAACCLLTQHDQIFEFAGLMDGQMPVSEHQFDCHELLNGLLTLLTPAAIDSGLKLQLEGVTSLPQYLLGDSKRLHRILLNVVGNAIKFTDDGHVLLNVSVFRRRDREIILQICVEDTGVGMLPAEKDTIFDHFTRLSASSSGVYTGLGCGLSIVKKFLDDIGGELHIDTTVDVGTVVSLFIPFRLSLRSC